MCAYVCVCDVYGMYVCDVYGMYACVMCMCVCMVCMYACVMCMYVCMQGCIQKFCHGGPIWGMEKRGGGGSFVRAKHAIKGDPGMLPWEDFVIFSALSFNLVQTEGKYSVGKKYQKCKGGRE